MSKVSENLARTLKPQFERSRVPKNLEFMTLSELMDLDIREHFRTKAPSSLSDNKFRVRSDVFESYR
jgi:hypothetical protein